MVTEIYGLPGSGKTYYAVKELIEKEGYEYPMVSSVGNLFLYTFLFWVRHPIFTARLFIHILKHGHGISDIYTKCVNGLGHRLARYYLPIQGRKRVVDEGMVHNILSLSDVALTEKEVVTLLQNMPVLADTYVRVVAPHEERKKRTDKRGYQFSRTQDKVRTKMLTEAMVHNETLVHKLLMEGKNIPVKTVEGTVTYEEK